MRAGCEAIAIVASALLTLPVALATSAQEVPIAEVIRVPRDSVIAAMLAEKQLGYDFLLTANAVRLQAGVILRLARSAQTTRPPGTLLLLHHADYFDAYLQVLGIPDSAAPTFMRIACANHENQLIDYGVDRVVRRVEEGSTPVLAVTVTAGWNGPPDAYSYQDTTSSPHARISHRRRNSYRILQYEDMVVHDDVQGIGGRATSGVLGVVFNVIGYGWATHSRTAVASDGTQVMRASAKKGFISVSQTVTIHPDGKVDKGVPADRPDLRALEQVVTRPVRMEYVPLPAEPWPLTAGDSGEPAGPRCARG